MLTLRKTKKWSDIDVAWAYLDQVPGCEEKIERVICYLHAAMWISKKFKPTPKLGRKTFFGLKCVVIESLKLAYLTTFRDLNPGMELYVIRLTIGIMRKIAQMPDSSYVLTAEDMAYLHIVLERLIKVSRMFPFWNPPPVSVSEAMMLKKITEVLHSEFILGLQVVDEAQSLLNSTDLKYQLFENDLRRIFPLENPIDCRARAMEELLLSQGWSWNDVVQTMSSRLTLRDAEGWIVQSAQLGSPQPYAEITGFVVDTSPEHPSIEILVVKADPETGKLGLFSQEDINAILQLSQSELPLYFSLDPPNDDYLKRFHPFQQWSYSTEKLKDSEFLNTMFDTDYLMKSFTVGSDVSSIPPFRQRPCKEGLTKNLPPELQEAIRSIHERGGEHSKHTHRFWIKAKEMAYSRKEFGTKTKYQFGEMKMIGKSHPMDYDIHGKLDDTDGKDDRNSPHAQFAKDMTDNYEQLSQYFPQFSRLHQLSKLQSLFMLHDSYLEDLKKTQNDRRNHCYAELREKLTKIKQRVGTWPTEKDRIKKVTIGDAVKVKVIGRLPKKDEETLNNVTTKLKHNFDIKDYDRLKGYVRDWLPVDDSFPQFYCHSKTPKDELVDYILSYQPLLTHQAFIDLGTSFKIQPPKRKCPCKWVPAAISTETRSAISYGGISIAPKLNETEYVMPHPNEISVSITIATEGKFIFKHSTYCSPCDFSKHRNYASQTYSTTDMMFMYGRISEGRLTATHIDASFLTNAIPINIIDQLGKFSQHILESPSTFLKIQVSTSGSIDQGDAEQVAKDVFGLYTLICLNTGEDKDTNPFLLYGGKSKHVGKRKKQHMKNIENGQKTIGKYIQSVKQLLNVLVIPVSPNCDPRSIQFLEQYLLTRLKTKYRLMNAINAMKKVNYKKMKAMKRTPEEARVLKYIEENTLGQIQSFIESYTTQIPEVHRAKPIERSSEKSSKTKTASNTHCNKSAAAPTSPGGQLSATIGYNVSRKTLKKS